MVVVYNITNREEAINALTNSIIGLINAKSSEEFVGKVEEYRFFREFAKEQGVDVDLANKLVKRIDEIK